MSKLEITYDVVAWHKRLRLSKFLADFNKKITIEFENGEPYVLFENRKYNIADLDKDLQLVSEQTLFDEFSYLASNIGNFDDDYNLKQAYILAYKLVATHCDWDEYINEDFKKEESIFIDESNRVKKILCDIYKDNSTILTLNSWEFEEVIAELLFKQGYKVELTKKTKDNGYDIIALMKCNMHKPLKFLVECKHYKKQKVGVDIIRSFKEVLDTENANRGIIVTTSYFTRGALKKQQQTPYLLEYRDKDNVIEWVKSYFDSFT